MADYLRAQAAVVKTALDANKEWTVQLPALYAAANSGKTGTTALRSRMLGEKYGALFRRCLTQVEKIVPPQPAARCHEYLARWLKFQISACDALIHAPDDGRDTSYLRDCHDYLDDARYAVKAFVELRQRLYEAATGKPAGSATQPTTD